MQGLIIAAGSGARLATATDGQHKALTKICGVRLIDRVIITAKQAGVEEFVITTGYRADELREHVGDGSRLGVRVDYVGNQDWEEGNGLSVLAAEHLLRDRFLLMMADHLFDVRILTHLVANELSGASVLAVDRRAALPGDTRVLERGGRIVDIGKEIDPWNCIDTGIFVCSLVIFDAIREAASLGQTEFSAAIRRSESVILDITSVNRYQKKLRKEVDLWWIDVDTPADLEAAEDRLIENASKNASDALAHYVHKPIENRLVRWISTHTEVTPNQISFAVNVVAYVVTGLFYLGYLLPASLLTFVVGIADGLDGKLARVKLAVTRVGALEHSFDMLYEFSWIIALGLYVYRTDDSVLPLILAGLIVTFVAFYRNLYDQFGKIMGRSLDDAGDFERHFRRIAGRRNLYNVSILVAVLIGVPAASLVAITIHSGLTALTYSWRAVAHMRA